MTSKTKKFKRCVGLINLLTKKWTPNALLT